MATAGGDRDSHQRFDGHGINPLDAFDKDFVRLIAEL